MNIEVVEERDNDVLVLLPVDRLDSTNARAFETIVMDHISKGEQRMIVDSSAQSVRRQPNLTAMAPPAWAEVIGE